MAIGMEKVFTTAKMATLTMETGKMVSVMEKESYIGQMVIDMKES